MVPPPVKAQGLPRIKRLHKAGVERVLSRGRRIQCRSFDIQFVGAGRLPGVGARFAISAPKKLLPTAVARNRVKRLVREVFRACEAGGLEYDVLIRYRLKDDCRTESSRLRVRMELRQLLVKLASTFEAA